MQAAIFELTVVWNCRSETHSVWRLGRRSVKNKLFVIAEGISILATLSIAYIPVTSKMFHLSLLPLTNLGLAIAVGCWGLFVLPELFMRRRVWKWEYRFIMRALGLKREAFKIE